MFYRTGATLASSYVVNTLSPCSANERLNANSSNKYNVTVNFRRTEAAVLACERERERRGFFSLPKLDYDIKLGIPPLFSRKQIELQYHYFHDDAVRRLNAHTIGSELEGHNLDVVIRQTAFDATRAVIHAAAAEHFNYCFWYRSLRPWGTLLPRQLREGFQFQYGQHGTRDPIEELKRVFTVTALTEQEQCGWVYLVWTGKKFDVLHYSHGTCPINNDYIPLLVLNIHESATIVDYDMSTIEGREAYLRNFFKTCNWNVAEQYYVKSLEKVEKTFNL